MLKSKTAFLRLILPFLATSFTAIAMDKHTKDQSIFKSTINFTIKNKKDDRFNTLMANPFKHEAYKPKIELLDNACQMGYGDQDCHKELNEAGFKSEKNSPLIPFKVTIDPNIINIAAKQKRQETIEFLEMVGAEVIDISQQENCSFMEAYEKLQPKTKIFQKRLDLMEKSANYLAAIPTMPWPSLIPVDYLDDSTIKVNTFNTNEQISLQFNKCQKIASLKKEFAEKPKFTFFTITNDTAKQMNAITSESTLEEKKASHDKLLNDIAPRKLTLIENGIIKKREFQHDDLQTPPKKTLPHANIIMHKCNYYIHGENGYSEEKSRKKLLEEHLDGQNPITFSNKRQKTGQNTHQILHK